jgi:hypothetical protein
MDYITMYAGLGKTLKRIADGMDFGNEITLGFTHYIGGVKLDTPMWELEEHYERVTIPNEDLRLGMVFKTEDNGTPYTITSFTDEGHPIYGEGELEVEIPEGYWEQFEPQEVEEEVEYMTQEDLDASIEIGDEITVDGKAMRCVAIENGVPQWTIIA